MSSDIATLEQTYVAPSSSYYVLMKYSLKCIGLYLIMSIYPLKASLMFIYIDCKALTPFTAACLAVLFLFDCAITLSQEVDVIWRRKWNTTTWLYALTRYSVVMDMIILLLPTWNFVVSRVQQTQHCMTVDLWGHVEVCSCVPCTLHMEGLSFKSHNSCEFMLRIDQALRLTQYLCLACESFCPTSWVYHELTDSQILDAGFSALRVYALLDGKYIVTALVLLLNVVPFATNIVSTRVSCIHWWDGYTGSSSTMQPALWSLILRNARPFREDQMLSTYRKFRSRQLIILTSLAFQTSVHRLEASLSVLTKKDATVSLATRISVIIGDVLVLAVTWTKTAQAYQEARRLNIRAPLATMLFRDGAMKELIVFLWLLMKSPTGTIYFLYVFLIRHISLSKVI